MSSLINPEYRLRNLKRAMRDLLMGRRLSADPERTGVVSLADFGKQWAIRDGQWKYVEHGNTQFLFDLNADVSERQNLFYEHTDVVNRLRDDLGAWQLEMDGE